MTKRFLTYTLLLVIGISLGWLGCSDDDNGGTGPTGPGIEGDAPATPKPVAILGPKETDANKTDSLAVTARQYVNAANVYLDMALGNLSSLEGVTPQHSGDTWTWVVEADDLTINMVGTPGEDGVDWTVALDGNMMGMTVKDWTAAMGRTDELGMSGTFTVYMPNTTTVMGTMGWAASEDGTITADTQAADLLTGEMVSYHIENRPDGSGSVTVSQAGQQKFAASWDAEGTVTPA